MPPRTRAAAEAVSARRNVLTDTDLLSLVFEQLDAPSLCRAATVCKVWQKTEVEKHWRALLASRWPHSDDLLEVVRKLDGYGQRDSKLGKVSKTMFRHYVRKGTISDFAFEVDMGYVFPEEENDEDLPDLKDSWALLKWTCHGIVATVRPHGLEFECIPSSCRILTALTQNYKRQNNGDDTSEWPEIPIDAEDAENMFDAGRENLQVRVTVSYASAEHVSVQKTFDMALDEDDLTMFETPEDPHAAEASSRLCMRVVPEPTEDGAKWRVVLNIKPSENYGPEPAEKFRAMKDMMIADLYDDSRI